MSKSTKIRNTRLDIKSKTRESTTSLMNLLLSDLLDLYSQTKHAHWNVKGPYFITLHELFDRLATSLDLPIDDLAERITTLGGTAMGTVRHIAQSSRLKELAPKHDGLSLVASLADRYATLAASVRAAIDVVDQAQDADSADLLTGLSRTLDKSVWLLESHLE